MGSHPTLRSFSHVASQAGKQDTYILKHISTYLHMVIHPDTRNI